MKNAVIDLHCDLLSYLAQPNSDINNPDDIGCAFPHLKTGNVKLQVMAIFAATEPKSVEFGLKQSEIFRDLNEEKTDFYTFEKKHLADFGSYEKVGMIAAVENGSAFCDENMPLKEGFRNLEKIIENTGRILYIGLTHHTENRFGGGNFATAGLKNDGKALIDYLHGRNIAIDFSHASDALAYDILNYISKENIKVPIIASHSNYREVFAHNRNLPDEIAKEIIHQKGLVGLNFIRAFVHPAKVEALEEHVAHGLQLGGENAICYGADYFYTKNHPDQSRRPFYFKEHDNAGEYQSINSNFERIFGTDKVEKISFKNALSFLERNWI
ncbi:Zn-dependent dipeptidase, dipeptidase homolog [Kaistella treverensis]|uniref:Zn-dependent dipeptidase, dipeptidase homolog n=1 Tax=Kaistella treverensis TaxID=631455 RepID=A0A1I3JL68_9FLAO|nr:membrane dipeptidase [Kaistella treverensis]SFI60914.1 Zn-dependent dipeptidase, dipeptidase homolog [Kaistella treverensis]